MTNRVTTFKIDGKVIETMLFTAALFLLLMAFRNRNTVPCKQVSFGFSTANRNDVAYEKERVYFSSQIKYDASMWAWDFGDKTPPDTRSGPYATHEYAQPGQYTVRLTINGKCEETKSISILKRDDRNRQLYLRPAWPPGNELVAGRDYYFGDSTLGAETWSWYFGKDESKRTRQNVRYQFLEPGEYTVVLVVNDDVEFGKTQKTYRVMPPARIATPIIPSNPIAGRGRGGGGGNMKSRPDNLPLNPGEDAGNDKTAGKSLEEMIRDASKLPTIGDATLKAYVLDIRGSGEIKLKDYLKNRSYSNLNIVFNGKSLSLDQLKTNMEEHARYGKSLSVTKETDPRENFIKVLEITAELDPKDRLIGKPKPRKYPY